MRILLKNKFAIAAAHTELKAESLPGDVIFGIGNIKWLPWKWLHIALWAARVGRGVAPPVWRLLHSQRDGRSRIPRRLGSLSLQPVISLTLAKGTLHDGRKKQPSTKQQKAPYQHAALVPLINCRPQKEGVAEICSSNEGIDSTSADNTRAVEEKTRKDGTGPENSDYHLSLSRSPTSLIQPINGFNAN